MTRALRLSDRYTVEDGTIYMSGLQALVRLPLDVRRYDRREERNTAGFISGYEGSPLGGYDLELVRHSELLKQHDIVFRPGLNEELAANAVQGSQLVARAEDARVDGVAGYWYGKAPGLDRATDALRHANLGGANPDGGALAIVGDDVTAKSSTVPSRSEMALAELCLPTLVPADPQDVLDLGLHGVMMSRFCGLWTGLKIGTNVADGSATIVVSPGRVKPVFPDNTVEGRPYRHTVTATFLQPTLAELEYSMMHQRLELAKRYASTNNLHRLFGSRRNARVGIVVAGATYLDVRQALDGMRLGEVELQTRGVRILKLGMVFPLDPDQIHSFADGLHEILVIEEKRSFVEAALKDILYGHAGAPLISGKKTPTGAPLLPSDGELSLEVIAGALRKRLGAYRMLPEVPELLPRPPRRRVTLPLESVARKPFFCSGCPHNRSTEAPDGSLVGAGIGCSGLIVLMPSERVGTVLGLTQMGGEGAPWLGMSPFVDTSHLVQNMGDGTYHHSGILAVRASVAGGSNITFKLLYNSAVAMTGGQLPVGMRSVPEMVRELLAAGVVRIVITTEEPNRYRRARLPRGVEVRHRDQLVRTQEELAAVPGVTVLIHDQECAAEVRRKRKRNLAVEPTSRAFINERVCEGCGDCGVKSNCLSVRPITTEYGRKTQIDQPSCNKDYSCLDGDCPSFLTVSSKSSSGRPRPTVPDLDDANLPTPSPTVPSESFAARIAGIGGTGVVTVAQMLAAAATLGGRNVRALDETGLAQKGGAVVSDVKIAHGQIEQANKIGPDQADLYLGCDVLVAASDRYLGVASNDRTVAVVSTAEVPTGAMVTDIAMVFPSPESTVGSIQARTRQDVSHFVDARALTIALFNDDAYANVFLVGVAFQAGAIPLEAADIEAAIALNRVAVDRNVQSFRRGRQYLCDLPGLQAAIATMTAAPATRPVDALAHELARGVRVDESSSLSSLVERRARDLVAYQNARYALRYVELIEQVRAAEVAVVGEATRLTPIVALNLHKLMAYKDEYEVARLSVDPALGEALQTQFGEGYRASYRLHPPMLRAVGLRRKITLGPWFRAVFLVLYALRRLRHTRLDVFGYTEVRRIERELITEYERVVGELVIGLSRETIDLAVEIASLPDLVRGYERIKLRNVETYRERLAGARREYAYTISSPQT